MQTGDYLKKTKILIVEDERIMAEDLKSRLEIMGYEVIGVAASGEHALELAEAHRPDLAMMDVQINGPMDGIETAHLLRDRFNVAFIYLTAYADRDTLDKIKPTAPHGFILKPFDGHELVGVLETALYKIHSEKLLKEKTSWLSSALRSMGDGLIAVDAQGRILLMSTEAEALTGWSQEGCSGAPLSDILILTDESTQKPWVPPQGGPGGIIIDEAGALPLLLHPKCGAAVPVEVSFAPMKGEDDIDAGMVCVIRNVAKRREAEQALRDSEDSYRRLYESITDAVATTDLDDHFIACNDVFCEMLGYTREEILSKTSFSITPERWHEEMRRRYYEEIVPRGYSDVFEKEYSRKDGSTVFVELRAFLLRDSHDEPYAVWGIIRDISERKANAIRQAREKAFREIVMHLATQFINLPLNKVPERLADALARIGAALDCGCCGLYQINKDTAMLDPMHAWGNVPAGCSCLSRMARHVLFQENQIRLLEEDIVEVRLSDRQRIQALQSTIGDSTQLPGPVYMLGLKQEGALIGCLVLEMMDPEHQWSDEKKDLLVVAVEMMNNVLGRVKSESVLRIRENRYRNLFENAGDCIFILDGDVYIDCNQKALNVFATSREAILGRTPLHFSPEYQEDGSLSSERAAILLERVMQGEAQFFEWTHIRANGVFFDCEVSLSRVTFETGVYVQSMVRDVSVRKRTERALRDSEARYRSLFEEVALGLFRCGADGRLQVVNPAFMNVTDTANEEVLLQTHIQAFHSDMAQYHEWRSWLDKYHTIHAFEMKWHLISGKEIWVRLNGKAVFSSEGTLEFIEGAIEEVTERRQAEEALIESEERLAQILYGSVSATFVLDEKHCVTHWNRACENLTGIKESDVCGGNQHWKGFLKEARPMLADLVLDGADDDTLTQYYGQQYRHSSAVPGAVIVESFFPHMGTHGKWLHYAAAPLYDRQERLVGAIETFSDITQRRMVESLIQIQAELGIALSRPNSLLETLKLCLDAALRLSNMEFGGVFLVDPQNGGLALTCDHGLSEMFPDQVSCFEADSKLARLIFKGEPIFDRDVDLCGIRTGQGKDALGKLAILPVHDGERIIACINLVSARKFRLSDPIKQALHTLVSQLGTVITGGRAQEALQQSEAQLRLFLDASTDIYMIWDRDLRLTVLNQKARDHFFAAYQAEALEGQFFLDLFPEAGPSGRYDAYLEVKASGIPFHVEEVVRQTTSGSYHIYDLRAFKVGDGIGLIATDVTEQRRMQNELLISEERFRALSENAQDTIMRFDREKRHLYVNPAVEQLTGYKATEFIGKKHEDMDFPEDLVREWGYYIDRVFETGKVQRSEFKMPNGKWVDWFLVPELDMEGEVQAVITSARDISGYKAVLQALEESEERFRHLADLLPQPIYEADLEGRITYANLAAYQIFGYDPSDMQRGVIDLELVAPEQQDLAQDATRAMLRGEDVPPIEYMAQRRDGTTFPMIVYSNVIERGGAAVGFRGIVLDITAIRQAEVALTQSEEKYRLLVERARDGIAIVTGEEIRFVNQPVCRMLDLQYDEVIGRPLSQFLQDEETGLSYSEIIQSVYSSEATTSFELTLKGAAGHKLPVEILVDSYQYRGEEAVLVYIRDITERKRAEAAKRQVQQAHHLASLGTLAAGISHEINQPLMALKVKVDSMLFWGEENPEILKSNLLRNLEFISSEADKIDQIIRHMRSLIRMEKVEPRPDNINAIIDRAIHLISQRLASHGIRLTCKYSKALPEVMLHATSVEQVMVNLLSNAMFALDQLDREDKWVVVRTRKAGKYCLIEVCDNGPGIPEELHARIFDPLYTTREKGEGMGLGLPIVQHLLMQIHGSIKLKNRSEGGAQFTIKLPLFLEEKNEE